MPSKVISPAPTLQIRIFPDVSSEIWLLIEVLAPTGKIELGIVKQVIPFCAKAKTEISMKARKKLTIFIKLR